MAKLKPTDFDKRLGERLQAARSERHVSQHAMAEALGVSAAQFQKYELGINRMSAASLQVCAQQLGMAPGAFFDPDPDYVAPDLGAALLRTKVALLRVVAEIGVVPA